MSPRRFRSLRLSTTLALSLGLALTGAACDKGGDGTTKPKANERGATDKTDKGSSLGDGSDYLYSAKGFTLTSTMKIKFELTTNEGAGAAAIEARSLLEATPTSDDKLQIHGKVLELVNYTGSGQLDPEFMKKQAEKQGQEPVDLVAGLREAESWLVVDRKGELDEAATKALAQNQKPDESAASDFGLFNLPDLPPVDLVEGEKVKLPTKEVQRQLPFGSVPVEIDQTWTLRSINAERVAEFDVSSEGSGATEISAQGQTVMISMLEESSFTVLFNLETQLPVSINGYSQSETSIDLPGQSITFSTNSELTGTYEAGAPG